MTRNAIRENLLVALDTLNSRKVRSGLTILGIVIGVTSVITVASIIDGLNGYIQARVQSFGSKTFFVGRLPAGRHRPPCPGSRTDTSARSRHWHPRCRCASRW